MFSILTETGIARYFFVMFYQHIHRIYIPNGIYFVTTNVRNRTPLFMNRDIVRIVERSIWHARTSLFVTYAFVVMPDHLHLLIHPKKGNISEIMKSIKENSSRDINTYIRQTYSGDGAVAAIGRFEWQKGFYDHVIRDERDFFTHIEYIRYNPVKAGLCKEPEEYPFLFVDEEAIQKASG